MEKVRSRNGRNDTIGLFEYKERSMNNPKDTRDTQAEMTIPVSLNQSLRGPSSSTYSRQPRARAMAAKCNQSMRRSMGRSGRSTSISNAAPMQITRPGSTLMKKIQRQSR